MLEQGGAHRDVPAFAEAPEVALVSDEDTPIADIIRTPTLRTMKEGQVDGPGDATGDSRRGMGRLDRVEAISVDEAEK